MDSSENYIWKSISHLYVQIRISRSNQYMQSWENILKMSNDKNTKLSPGKDLKFQLCYNSLKKKKTHYSCICLDTSCTSNTYQLWNPKCLEMLSTPEFQLHPLCSSISTSCICSSRIMKSSYILSCLLLSLKLLTSFKGSALRY